MLRRHRRGAAGALVLLLAVLTPAIAAAQTGTSAPTTLPAGTSPSTTVSLATTGVATSPAATTVPVKVAVTTRRVTATTVRRATTTARRASTSRAPSTAAPETTVAPTTTPTTVAPSTIPPTTIALVTTPSVASATVNDASSTRTVNGVIVGLLVLAGVMALLTVWFYRRTEPLPASLEVLEFMGKRSWRKTSPAERDGQLAALRRQIGEVAAESIVTARPVPIARPASHATEPSDDSVADALVGLVPPPPASPAPINGGTGAASEPEPPPSPGEVPAADTLDPHG